MNALWSNISKSKQYYLKNLQVQKINSQSPKGKGGRNKLAIWDQQMHTTIYQREKQQGFTI